MGLTRATSLRLLSYSSSAVFFLVLVASTQLPLFDSSSPRPASHLLRWDTLHFIHIAGHGYVYEHEWAFLPAAPLIIRYSILHNTGLAHFLLSGAIAALACETTQTLYALSLHHLRSPNKAYLASLLSLLSTSPATLLFVPYNEPFFTFLSYSGMLACARHQWIRASLFFSLASTFRSNGILLSGFIIWGLLVHPFLLGQKIPPRTLLNSIILITVVILPFVAHQVTAYVLFCSATPAPEWCSHFPPSIYTHVQLKYWNVGFLRYWTWSQLPNFIIAAPSLALIFAFAFHHFRSGFRLAVKDRDIRHLLISSITPHAIHAVFFSCLLLFASHTQIILRLAASMPFFHWAAAWLYSDHLRFGTMWVTWCVLWGLISTLLWATFLPPA